MSGMAFAGASLIADGKLCAATESVVDAGADSGYHLLAVQGYSRTKETIRNGDWINSRPFIVGGRRWTVEYSPNGNNSDDEEFISLGLVLDDDLEQNVEVQFVFSFIGQPELRKPKSIRQSLPVYLHGASDLDGGFKFMGREGFERSRHLKDDSFVLRCDLVVRKPVMNKGLSACSTARLFTKLPQPNLQSQLANLLLSKECADITFEIGGEEFAAHRCLLVARSTVFRAQLSGATAMNESSVVKISGIKADVFRGLLNFIYTDAVPDFDNMEAAHDHDETYAIWLLQFLEAAERYDLQKLKSVCEEKLASVICGDMEADIIANELLSKIALLNL